MKRVQLKKGVRHGTPQIRGQCLNARWFVKSSFHAHLAFAITSGRPQDRIGATSTDGGKRAFAAGEGDEGSDHRSLAEGPAFPWHSLERRHFLWKRQVNEAWIP